VSCWPHSIIHCRCYGKFHWYGKNTNVVELVWQKCLGSIYPNQCYEANKVVCGFHEQIGATVAVIFYNQVEASVVNQKSMPATIRTVLAQFYASYAL